jgi:DNA-binding Lrp family transcriptional regulator
VLQALKSLFESNIARRFGAVFDSRHLGYGSTLCAVDVPESELERVAELFAPHTGVTHCYEREGNPNLWFTMTAPADRLQSELDTMAAALAPYALLNLPAIKRFKVQVVLDAGTAGDTAAHHDRPPESGAALDPPDLSPHEKALIRRMQGNLPLTLEPFVAVAQELDWDTTELLVRLRRWKEDGILRRVGVILRHRNAGFTANGMCIWRADPATIDEAGRCLARCPEVTHCYERPPVGDFHYNLFAMVHARQREITQEIFERISKDAGLTEGRVLISKREFKKTSPVFFCENDSPAGTAAS